MLRARWSPTTWKRTPVATDADRRPYSGYHREKIEREWRKAAESAYRRYGLFTLKGLESRHGGGKKDIAALFTYAVMDHFVKDGGVLALVVHVSLFKTSGAGEGYRRFQLGNGTKFAVEEAHDFKSFQPFQTEAKIKIKTRTLTFRAVKGKETSYPIPYHVWTKIARGHVPGGIGWAEARDRLAATQVVAVPLRGTEEAGRLSPWLTVPANKLVWCQKVIAPVGHVPHYEGREGINTGGLNGAFFLEILDRLPNGTVKVQNIHDTGKIECPQVVATLEAELVHPLLRGRDMARWKSSAGGHVLIVQDPKTQRGYPEKRLQTEYPLTWSYLKRFEKLLRERKAFQKFFNPKTDPFYSMYSVGVHTFQPFKVAWMDISSSVKATVLEGRKAEALVIPEHTVLFLTTGTADEAYFVAAVLNSEVVDTVVSGYIVDNHLSTHPIENIAIPKYDPSNTLHARLVSLSRAAHRGAAKNDEKAVGDLEAEINAHALRLW